MLYAVLFILAVAAVAYWRYRSTIAKEAAALKTAAKNDVATAEHTANLDYATAKAKLDELLGHGPKVG